MKNDMNDNILLHQLINDLNKRGYSINSHMDMMKLNYTDSEAALLMAYLVKFQKINYKELIIRCLTQKKLYSAYPILFNEFTTSDNNNYRWVIANAMYTINYKSPVDDYIKIVLNKSYRTSRQMIVLLLGRIKTPEAENALISLLNDYDVLLQTVKSLSHFTSINIYNNLKQLISDENKKKFISDLKKLKERDEYFQYVDIDSLWKSINKESEKIIKKYNI